MAKKKKDLLEEGSIESAITVETSVEILEVKLKSQQWTMKATIHDKLDKSYLTYRLKLSLNEAPDLERIAEITEDLARGLFKDEPQAKKNAQRQIVNIEAQLEKNREICEDIEAVVAVFALKHLDQSKTQLEMLIPDTMIEALNRQKGRIRMYKVALVPQL